MRCLLIDNYDSFTWNLADYIGQVFGEAPTVICNDQYSWAELCTRLRFDCIVVSPGPGSVINDADFNVSRHAVLQERVPVLGVCLGFQGIAYAYGCRIEHLPVPVHGRASAIHHDGQQLFDGIASPFNAIRYHSLVVAPPLTPDLVATAHTDTGLIMGLRHRTLPKWGVQFHPESILTEHGLRMIANFRDLAYRFAVTASRGPCVSKPAPTVSGVAAPRAARTPQPTTLKVLARKFAAVADAEAMFATLFAASKHCFWLDSQLVQEGTSPFSFMGTADDADVLTYTLEGDPSLAVGLEQLQAMEDELVDIEIQNGDVLPFDFRGGLVGYLSYEMKALFGADRLAGAESPDMVWLRVRRFVAFDHAQGAAWVVALTDGNDLTEANEWIQDILSKMHAAPVRRSTPRPPAMHSLTIEMDSSYDDYIAAIANCKRAIVEGESYQVCLTNRFSLSAPLDPYDLYVAIRSGNPAPFGAFLRSGKYCVLSTSPERFLQVSEGGRIQTKPIKGTAPRSELEELDEQSAAALASSVKDRAENLMIVDLMRNDLSRVAVPGSVSVPVLMDVESYQTVHQLVSTVEATLRADCSLIDLLRATFPGGSITGAPKIRTMQIIDQLERSPRGVYCGAVGYLGYGRVADLSIAIRALSYDGATLRFGGGGAITYLSDPDSEFSEMLLKALAVLRPIWKYLAGDEQCMFQYHLDHNQLRLGPLARDNTAG